MNKFLDDYNWNRGTKMQVSIMLLLVLFFSVVGATYAYFAFSATSNNTITGNAATVNLTLSVEKIFPKTSVVNTGVMVPQLSNSGSNDSPLSLALKDGCVDDNTNVVCQVYKIDIANNGGTATQVVDGMISFYSDAALNADVHAKMPNLKWKLIDSVDAVNTTNSILGTNTDMEANSSNNVFADDILMPTGASFTYYMIIWINETGSDQKDKSTTDLNQFYGVVTFNSANGTGVTSTFSS